MFKVRIITKNKPKNFYFNMKKCKNSISNWLHLIEPKKKLLGSLKKMFLLELFLLKKINIIKKKI